MNIIYIKLGTGTEYYENVRVGVRMNTDMPLAEVNFDDMDSGMIDALNAEIIVQITADQYYNLLGDIVIIPPTTVNTNYLITLSNYITGCPHPGDALFVLRSGVFYKVAWSDLKDCIGSKPHQIWRVGSVGKPAIGDTVYEDDIFEKDVTILVNSLRIYEDVEYDPSELADIDHYVQDRVAKTITRPATFGGGELIEITQI